VSDASVSQYGTPTPTPTCVTCAPPPNNPGLPNTGMDVAPIAAGGVLLIVLGVALRQTLRRLR
jgi:hypothetical protein